LAINIGIRNPNIKKKKRKQNKKTNLILDKVLHGERLKGFDLKLRMNSRFFFINMNIRVSLRVSRLISWS